MMLNLAGEVGKMEGDDKRLNMLRESIRLTEEILSEANQNPRTQLDPTVRAKLIHGRDWRIRYLNHIEEGGSLLEAGDEWSMHHGHDLAIEWGYETWDENRIGLRCRSCDDWIQLYDVDRNSSAVSTVADLYLEHETHTVVSWRQGLEAGIECVTCGAVNDKGFPLLEAPVSEWFDEVWNG